MLAWLAVYSAGRPSSGLAQVLVGYVFDENCALELALSRWKFKDFIVCRRKS
jgi:hypothetical protein